MDAATNQTRTAKTAAEGKTDTDAQIEGIRRDLAALVQALGAFGRGRGEALASGLREASQEALDELRPLLRDVQHRLARAEKDIEHSVHEHPGRWLGGVLGLIGFGILFGLLFGRRT